MLFKKIFLKFVTFLTKSPMTHNKAEIIRSIINNLEEGKATDIVCFECPSDLVFDFVIVASGTSSRHLDGVSEKILMLLKHDFELKPLKDGRNKSWITIDATNIIIHFMMPEERHKYNIEDLMEQMRTRRVPFDAPSYI